MKFFASFLAVPMLLIPAHAQVFTFTHDEMLKYTSRNPFDRFEDGRPKVPDAILEKVKGLSAEEVWAVLPGGGFHNQYEGNFRILHPNRKLVGRAVTVQFMPARPDVADIMETDAKAKGLRDNGNQRVLDLLKPGDVLVADLFGKIEEGTIVGDNLATYIFAITGTGLVVDGAIRDLEGIQPLDMSVYCRGVHPTPIRNVMLTGINVPIRIGSATVMPGDVVFGDSEGVYFIPPQMVKQVVDKADETHIHDEWTQDEDEDREIQVDRHLSQSARPGTEEGIRRLLRSRTWVNTETDVSFMKNKISLALCAPLVFFSHLIAANWLSYGHDPQRTGWSPQETDLNRDNAKSMTLLWKAHLDNQPRELNSLTAPVNVEWVTTDKGMAEIVIVGGASDNLFALDAGTGKLIWKKSFEAEGKPRRGTFLALSQRPE